MVNFFNQFFLKRIYKGPSTHFVKPKVLNIRYRGNKLPNYTFLNLEDVFTATPDLKKKDDNTYSLSLKIIKNDNKETIVELGHFTEEKYAKEAYVKTINAFFSPSSSILKFFLTIAIIGAALQVTTSYIFGMSNAISKRNAEIALQIKNETERKAKEEYMKKRAELIEAGKLKPNPNTAISGSIPQLLENANKSMPQIPQIPNPTENSNLPSSISLGNKEKFSSVHEDLDAEIKRIREGKESGKIDSPADILLKELQGQ